MGGSAIMLSPRRKIVVLGSIAVTMVFEMACRSIATGAGCCAAMLLAAINWNDCCSAVLKRDCRSGCPCLRVSARTMTRRAEHEVAAGRIGRDAGGCLARLARSSAQPAPRAASREATETGRWPRQPRHRHGERPATGPKHEEQNDQRARSQRPAPATAARGTS